MGTKAVSGGRIKQGRPSTLCSYVGIFGHCRTRADGDNTDTFSATVLADSSPIDWRAITLGNSEGIADRTHVGRPTKPPIRAQPAPNMARRLRASGIWMSFPGSGNFAGKRRDFSRGRGIGAEGKPKS